MLAIDCGLYEKGFGQYATQRAICQGDSIEWHDENGQNHYYKEAGTYDGLFGAAPNTYTITLNLSVTQHAEITSISQPNCDSIDIDINVNYNGLQIYWFHNGDTVRSNTGYPVYTAGINAFNTDLEDGQTYIVQLTTTCGVDTASIVWHSCTSSSGTVIRDTVCIGSGYAWNGQTYTQAGMYTNGSDTLILSVNQSALPYSFFASCDSIVLYASTDSAEWRLNGNIVIPPFRYQGNSYYFAQWYNPISSGTYSVHLTKGMCSYDTTFVLNCNSSSTSNNNGTNTVHCGSDSLSVDWSLEHSLTNSCVDSLLLFTSSTDSLYIQWIYNGSSSIVGSSSYQWNGHPIYYGNEYYRLADRNTQSGVYTAIITTLSGCRDTVNFTVSSCDTSSGTLMRDSICASSSYAWNGNTYSQTGTYINGNDTLILTVNTSAVPYYFYANCDSIILFAQADSAVWHLNGNTVMPENNSLGNGYYSAVWWNSVPSGTYSVHLANGMCTYDTTFILSCDTSIISPCTVFDTIHVYDTIHHTVYDTVHVTVTDTLVINVNITGLNPLTYQNTILIYPNPTSDQVIIDFGSNYSALSGYTLRITNIAGQTMFTASVTSRHTSVNLLSFANATAGVYIVSLTNAQDITLATREIVLQ